MTNWNPCLYVVTQNRSRYYFYRCVRDISPSSRRTITNFQTDFDKRKSANMYDSYTPAKGENRYGKNVKTGARTFHFPHVGVFFFFFFLVPPLREKRKINNCSGIVARTQPGTCTMNTRTTQKREER